MKPVPQTQSTECLEPIVSLSAAGSFAFVFCSLFFITGLGAAGFWWYFENWIADWSLYFLMGAAAAVLSLLSARQTLKYYRQKHSSGHR